MAARKQRLLPPKRSIRDEINEQLHRMVMSDSREVRFAYCTQIKALILALELELSLNGGRPL